MARTRLIKPGFFENEDLASLPCEARLLFAGLWTIADRSGRLEDRPARIRAKIFPYDTFDVNALLDALSDKGFVMRYTVKGERFLSVLKFAAHQHPHVKEPASTIPAPDKHQPSTIQALERHQPSRAVIDPVIDTVIDTDTVSDTEEESVNTSTSMGNTRQALPVNGRKTRTELERKIAKLEAERQRPRSARRFR